MIAEIRLEMILKTISEMISEMIPIRLPLVTNWFQVYTPMFHGDQQQHARCNM